MCFIGYLLDPHTAVAKAVADKFRVHRGSVPLLVCGTTHYAKCPQDVLLALTGNHLTDLSNDVSHRRNGCRSPMATIDELHQQLTPGTRPAMHAGLYDVMSRDVTTQPPVVLPTNFESVVAHVKTLV